VFSCQGDFCGAGKISSKFRVQRLIVMKKSSECFDRLSMNGKISNDFNRSSVRPEALEG
jgi:hypothetical protein